MRANRVCAGVLAAMVGLTVIACSSDDDKVNVPPNKIGMACSSQSDCTKPDGVYCSKAEVCTKECTTHSECGCAEGTVSGDIQAGKCRFSCVGFSSGGAYCFKTCTSNADCAGTQTCQDATTAKLYKICVSG
jgi:hypothetical protein